MSTELMFDKFISVYGPTQVNREGKTAPLNPLGISVTGCGDFMSKYSGISFAGGLYRVHELESIEKWNEVISEALPEFHGGFSCFGFDWLGRQFALDAQRLAAGEPEVLMFEPGTGEVLEIPATFASFHNHEIVAST